MALSLALEMLGTCIQQQLQRRVLGGGVQTAAACWRGFVAKLQAAKPACAHHGLIFVALGLLGAEYNPDSQWALEGRICVTSRGSS